MSRYNIEFDRRVKKDLNSVPAQTIERIKTAIANLADNPYPPSSVKLKGQNQNYWRIRVGNYRVIYTVENEVLLIIVIRVGHRREIYKKLSP